MKTLFAMVTVVAMFFGMLLNVGVRPGNNDSDKEASQREDAEMFEKAVTIIKKYETLHQPKHWPLVGYGHKVLPKEKYSRSKALSEAAADRLLREDLLKNCAVFRKYGKDSLLLGVLAYNLGSGTVRRSSLVRRLEAGDRDIEKIYLSFCKYRGRTHNQLRARRVEEFEALFIRDTIHTTIR